MAIDPGEARQLDESDYTMAYRGDHPCCVECEAPLCLNPLCHCGLDIGVLIEDTPVCSSQVSDCVTRFIEER